ncbi:Phytoene desaturase (lycopene-forming) [Aquisphaera giovannonii]|uniref:Pyridine nucleotide-disulfide oxidoreductase domain-containing protein 2 n=1 Tax=Aquisphaera giovannonii TaxID=406548 RepID=A0A5B9W091_9BACT|nr:NAD(P)/FAD-dependent oxidoreductase [Aquisphaera giovannonii]QEH34042.1 Phytoene desaturase (lycopene-forming) [Aquisphaera giovannonii]
MATTPGGNRATLDTLGAMEHPEPSRAFGAREWDAIIIGAGHNGLTCAAYLARSGQQVLVLESRKRVGGACTIDEPWPGYRVSPCAYLLGLLHPLVIDELRMADYGFSWTPAEAGLFVPFEDGSSIQLWDDEDRCEAEIRRFSPADLDGWRDFSAAKARLRDALRPPGARDLWIGPAPSQEDLEERIGGDHEARHILFEWSMVECVENYFQDERLQMAYLGQGVIGTNASPHDRGTASIHFHHQSGRLGGMPGMWGYVKGGMGMVSFLLCDIARDLGVTVATGVPVARIVPGEGVELAGGGRVRARHVISNADPRATLRMLGGDADPAWKGRVEAVPQTGCTVKLNVALSRLPSFKSRPGASMPHHAGQINTPLTKQEWAEHFRTARSGELPRRLWTELYFQTVHDPSVAPAGVHTMSVFGQYVPHTFSGGDWDSRRDEVRDVALGSIARFCEGFPESVIQAQVLGPPDIEEAVGLTGGQIFQGECLPPYMWDRRLSPRTPMPGVFLCGACTHPGGSVIGVNGRNAAMEVLGRNDGAGR